MKSLKKNSLLVIFWAFSFGVHAQNITQVEYYIDNDPGYGLATSVTVSPANVINNLVVNVGITNALSDGFHQFHIRAKDVNGNWSVVAHHPFLKTTFSNPPNPIPNIVQLEYYVDSDPGYGIATPISIVGGSPITGVSVNIPIENTWSDGFHRVHVRAKDANGKWSEVAHHPFLKTTFSNPPNPIPNIIKAEYYIDTDPGFDAGINIPLTANTSINNLSASINLTGLSLGTHKVYVRAKDANNHWSIIGNKTISIETNALLLGITPASFCKNVPFNVSFGAYGTFNAGNVFTAQLMSGSTVIATLGTLTSTASGTISATIPNSVSLGNYEIRVVSSSPSSTDFPRVPISIVSVCPSPCLSNVVLVSTADDYSTGSITKQASATNGTITATNAISGTANVTYQAKSTVLNAGFKADSGVIFKVEVGGCN